MKKNLLTYIIFAGILAVFFFPGFSKLQQLKEENKNLESKIEEYKRENANLRNRLYHMKNDPIYLESVARHKLKRAKKGEVIYKTE